MSRGRPSRRARAAARAQAEKEAAEKAQVVTQRAIKRLDLLEWAIFGIGAILAMGGGAVVALILAAVAEWDFRSTWIGASLLLFVVPGIAAITKIRRDERADAPRAQAAKGQNDG